MAKQAAPRRIPAARKKPARTMEVVKAEPMQLMPSHEAISRRAFEIFQSRGGFDGQDMNDWLTAERELRTA